MICIAVDVVHVGVQEEFLEAFEAFEKTDCGVKGCHLPEEGKRDWKERQ